MRFLKILTQKVIAGNLLLFFFANTVFGSIPSTGLLIPERLKALSTALNPLDLPAGMVTVVRQSDSGTAPVIIHIQDAHANEEAQLRIREVLKELTQRHHIRLIGLEGLAGRLRPESFRAFPEKEANAAVARQLVREGELTGAELFAIENEDAGVEWLGLEDKNIYRRDLELFQTVLAKWASVEPDFRRAENSLLQAKTKIFSKTLLSFDGKAGAFQKRQIGLLSYARLLKRKSARILGKDLSDSKNQREFPNFVRVMLLSRAEERLKIRAQQIKQEREKLTALLNQSRHKDRDFVAGTLARLDGSKWPLELAPRYFFEALHGLCREAGIRLEDFPAFREYAEFFILQSEMDASGLFREISRVENEIYAKLIRTGEEKKLFDLHRRLELTEKFLRLEVSREEYDNLKSRQNDYAPSGLFSEINRLNETPAVASLDSPDVLFSEADGFYRLAGEREQFFIDRLLDAMRTKKLKQAVLISGGFHSAGIQHLLDQKGIASVTLAPRISGEGDPSVYHRVILNGKTWLDEQMGNSVPVSRSKIVAALEAQDLSTYGFVNPGGADRPYRSLAGGVLRAGLSVILRLRGEGISDVRFQPESLLSGGTVQIQSTSSNFQISAELPTPQGPVTARGKLSKTSPYAPMGAFTVTSAELTQAASLGKEIRRVLIADDSPGNLLILKETVRILIPGVETVDTAKDGEEAWQKFQALAYDFVLTDLQMPRLDGAGLAARINPPGRAETVPVIMATTRRLENEKTLDALLESGQLYAALEKPFGLQDLAGFLERIQGLPEGQSLGWDERESGPTSRRVSDAIHLYFFSRDEEVVKSARKVLIKELRKHHLGDFNFDVAVSAEGNEKRRFGALLEARRYFRNLKRDLFPESSSENPDFTFQVLRERMYAGMGVGQPRSSKRIELIESTSERRQMVNVSALIPQQPRVYSKELFTRELLHDQIESAPVLVLQTDDGKMFLLDGHHRAVTALRAGETQIEAHIIKTTGLKPQDIPGNYELPFWKVLSSYRIADTPEDLENAEMVDSLENIILKLPSASGDRFEFFRIRDLPRRGYIPPHHGASLGTQQPGKPESFDQKLLELGHMFKDDPGAAQALNDLIASAQQSEIEMGSRDLLPQVKPGDVFLVLKTMRDAKQEAVPSVFRLYQITPDSYIGHSVFRDRDVYEIPAANFRNRVTRNEIKRLSAPSSGTIISEAVAQSLGGADTIKGFDLLAASSQKAVELYERIPLMARGTGDFNLLQYVVLQAVHKVVQFARKLAEEKHTDWLGSDFTAQDFKSLLAQTVDLIPEQVLHENEEATIPVIYRGPHNTQILVAGQSFAPVYYLIRYRDDQVTEMGIDARELFGSGEKYVLAPGAYPLRWIGAASGKGGQAKLRPLFDGEEVLHLRELLKPVLTMPETDRQSIKDLRLIAEYLDLLYDANGIKKYSSEAQSLGASDFDQKLLDLGRMFKDAPEAAADLTALIAASRQSEIEVSGRDLAPQVKAGDIFLALRTIRDAKQQAVPPVFRLYQITADSYIAHSVFRDRDVYEIPAAVFKNRVTRNEIRMLTAQSLGTEEPIQPAGLPLKKGDYLKIDGKDVAQIRATRVLEGGKQVIEIFVGSQVGLSLKMLLELLSIPRRSVIGVWLEPATGTKKPTGPPKQNDVLPAGKVMTLAVDLKQYRDVMDTLTRAINTRMIPLIQKELDDPDITAANLAQHVYIEIQPSAKKRDTFYFHFTHVNQRDQFLEGMGKRTEPIDASRGSWFVLVEELIWDLMAAGNPETAKDVLENTDFAARISALSAAAQTVQASSLGLDFQDKYFFEIDGIRRGSALVATVAIRYLDVFRKIAEAKGSPDEPYVDADETDRLFMINSPDGKSVHFGISDQKISPVLIQSVTFAARPILAEAPGGNVADIAIEPEYPLVTEWDKTTKSVSAVYIPASPEKDEYLKLEILEQLPQRPAAPYDASQDIFQEDTRGGKLIRVLQTHLALNHIVLRASIVQGDELRFAMEKAGELPIKGQSLGEGFQAKLRAAEALKIQGRSLDDVTGTIDMFTGRMIGPWEKPEVEQFLLGIYASDDAAAPVVDPRQSALKTDLIEYGAQRKRSAGPDVYTEAYNGSGKFAILAATSRDLSVEAVERQLILNPLARVAVAAIQDPDFEARLKQRLGGLMARIDLQAVQTEEEAAVFFNTLLKGPYLEKMRDFYRADLNQRDLARHIVFLAGESVLAGLDASLASRLLVPDAKEIGSMDREAVKIYHNSLGYLLAREGGDFDELSRQIPDVRNALNPSGLEFRLNLTGLAERVSELYAEFQGFMQMAQAA